HFHFWLGQINYALKEFADAIRNFTTALKVRPKHSPTLLRLASCYFHVKDYARSVRLLEKAILREPARLQLYTLLGVVFLASKNHGAALSAFRHAEKISPKDTFTQRYLNILGEE
ncbi:MAG: tetratricopeptide repeat protein, partial [bacterium]